MIPPREYLASLPPDTPVPVRAGDLLELQVGGDGTIPLPTPPADFTVEMIASRFGRAPSTIRAWNASGKLTSYVFNGRERRITPAALAAFEESLRSPEAPRLTSSRRKPADLTAWRRAVS